MRLKITLTLLAILLGLLTYIFYIDNRSDFDSIEKTRASVLGDLAVGIDYLSIQRNATGQNVTLNLNNKRWMLEEPYLWPANDFAVQRILTELRFLKRISSFDTDVFSNTGMSLSDYGLAPPQISLRFGRGDQRTTLNIGKPTEIGNNLYVLSTDQKQVLVVDRSLLDSISINLDHLRSSRLFDIAVFEATTWNIQVREDNRNLRAWFARNGDNWVFETPIRARADSAAVNTLLNRCLSLEADSIIASNPSDLSPYGLQNPLYRIAIESDLSREVLEIGERISEESEYRYAKRENRPTVFQLRIDFLDLLANAQTKLRERRIFEVDVTEASTVTIEQREQQPLTLQKLENGEWEIVVRDENQGIQILEGDVGTIEEILKWLDQLKAVPDTGFVNDAPSDPEKEIYGLEVPEFSVTVTSNKRYDSEVPLSPPLTETLHIGDPTPNAPLESYVKIDRKEFVYAVYNDLFERIDNEPLLYKNRHVVNLPSAARLQSLRIERLADRAWVLDTQLDPQSQDPANTLAAIVSQLTVDSYLNDGFTRTIELAGREQPWAYRLLLDYQIGDSEANGKESVEIYISETTGGPILYGGIAERDLGFRFGSDFIDTFTEITFDRVAREAPEEPFSSTPLPDSDAPSSPSTSDRFEASPPVEPSDSSE